MLCNVISYQITLMWDWTCLEFDILVVTRDFLETLDPWVIYEFYYFNLDYFVGKGHEKKTVNVIKNDESYNKWVDKRNINLIYPYKFYLFKNEFSATHPVRSLVFIKNVKEHNLLNSRNSQNIPTTKRDNGIILNVWC